MKESPSASFYASIIQNSQDGIISLTPEGKITSWNRGCEKLYGYTSTEAIGQTLALIFPADRRKEAEMFLSKLKEGESIGAFETINHTKDGRRIDVLLSFSVIRGEDGALQAVASVAHDITARKHMEKELRLLNENLESRIYARTQEMERRAVQLRTLASQLIEVEQQERRRFSQLLHDHLQQILVGAKMMISKIKNSPQRPVPELQEVMDIMDEAIKESKSLTVQLSPPLSLSQGLRPAFQWLADWANRMHQLKVTIHIVGEDRGCTEEIGYFIFNAVKECLFNVVKHAKTQEAEISAEWGKDELKVTVSDHGTGFNLDQLDRFGRQYGLFNIFQRVDLLGGKCHIESDKNGTKVIFSMPIRHIEKKTEESAEVKKKQPAADKPNTVSPKPLSRKIQVLIADDQKMVRRGISILLQEFSDIEIVGEAQNGIQAVEKARELKPDVLLMDVSMPHMDGIEATKIIKEEMPQIRIIILSMHEEEEMSQVLHQVGASRYLTKSAGQDEIAKAIRMTYQEESPSYTA